MGSMFTRRGQATATARVTTIVIRSPSSWRRHRRDRVIDRLIPSPDGDQDRWTFQRGGMPKVVVASFLVIALGAIACGSVPEKPDAAMNCSVSCNSDTDCASGNTCSNSRCTNGPSCPCTAGEFLGCTADNASANICNAAGNGVDKQSCVHGCNATAAKCNVCDPTAVTCSSDKS